MFHVGLMIVFTRASLILLIMDESSRLLSYIISLLIHTLPVTAILYLFQTYKLAISSRWNNPFFFLFFLVRSLEGASLNKGHHPDGIDVR